MNKILNLAKFFLTSLKISVYPVSYLEFALSNNSCGSIGSLSFNT